MPVTAKFSEEVYDKLGHPVADELVDWFNKVDATYRSEFRELFDTRFAHLDAKLEQRLAHLETRLIRWMFLFWVGSLGTTLALIGTAIVLTRFWNP
jgi:hypothetical protein